MKVSFAIPVALATILAVGCSQQQEPGSAEKTGKKIDQAVEKAGQQTQQAMEKAQDYTSAKLKEAGQAVERAGEALKKE